MDGRDEKLSPEAFERLIARAVQIDDQGAERIDTARAREIAAEVGVSGAGWDAAVREWSEARAELSVERTTPRVDPWRVAAAAAAGGIAGIAMGFIAAASTGDDIAIGSAVIAAGVSLGAYEYVKHSARQAQASIGAWWVAAAPGIATIGMSGTSSDAMWYAALSWAGCAAAIAIVDALSRRLSVSTTN
jgi:hypothetical protein